MSYQVLARKYRPQSFDDIIGQAHVATTLVNALRQQKVAHAYLFSGPRGVGKTTSARILAKALNCAKGPTAEPCNQCDSCQRIAQGQEMVDVLEIDAASNRGIEEIRELRENVRYAPARSRYKVYIVDEAHQITHDAFNAFLKTLEEPPEHAVFILATTEPQKIPATILSRCQMFRFKRVSAEEIATRLEKILSQEKLTVEKTAVQRLARAAGGSVRDALSLLDQALAYTSGPLTAQQVEMLLGFLPEEFLQGFAAALVARDPAKILQWVKRLGDEGWELPQFVRDLREYLRRDLVTQISAGTKPAALKIAGQDVPLAALLQMIRLLGQCLDEMKWNDNPELVLELYALRLTQPFVEAGPLLERLRRLEKSIGAAGGVVMPAPVRIPTPRATEIPLRPSPLAGPPTIKPSSSSAVAGGEPSVSLKMGSTPATAGNDVKNQSAFPAPLPTPAEPSVAVQWKKLLSTLWAKPGVATQMDRAWLRSATEAEWVVGLPDKFALDSVLRSQAFIAETLVKIVGRPVTLRFVQETRPAGGAADDDEAETVIAHPAEEGRTAAATQDPKVRKVMAMFKGKIRPPDADPE